MSALLFTSALIFFGNIQNGSSLDSWYVVKGSCVAAQVLGDNVTKVCSGPLVNSTYTNGRSNIAITLTGIASLSFSGDGSASVSGEDRATQPIDRVIIIYDGEEQPQVIAAVGQCTSDNPYKGVATTRCAADIGVDTIEIVFRSDGAPPEVTEFR